MRRKECERGRSEEKEGVSEPYREREEEISTRQGIGGKEGGRVVRM